MPSLSGQLPNIRQLYTAGPGYKLIQADFKQLELRVMAAIAKDEVLEAAIATGDVYTEDARAIFAPGFLTKNRLQTELGVAGEWKLLVKIARDRGVLDKLIASMQRCKCSGGCKNPDYHISNDSRQSSKFGHLGFQYGCGLPQFHRLMLETDQSVTWGLSKHVFESLRKRYWRTVEYWKEEMARVRRNCYSETRILFNRRTYPALPDLSEVANFPIQGTAAEIANIAMVALDEDLCSRYPRHPYMIIMQQHDAFVLEVLESLVEEVSEILRNVMEQPHIIEGREWVFPVDIKSGKRFSDT